MARILLPLPDRDFDVTEVAVPWRLLTSAGHQVIFATEHGATPAADPLLLTGVLWGQLGAAPEACSFYRQMEADPAFRSPLPWAALEPASFDGLILAGGHAPGMRQYLGSELLQQKVGALWALETPRPRPVGAICHGVLVLARTIDPGTGRSVLHDRRTTCLPKYMERTAYLLTFWKLGRYYRTYPAYVEDEVRAALDNQVLFQRGPRTLTSRDSAADGSPGFVVRDGRYVSARWPGDAYSFTRAFRELLEAPRT